MVEMARPIKGLKITMHTVGTELEQKYRNRREKICQAHCTDGSPKYGR